MNSMIEYIRQINQTSITLKAEWLDRLRHVDVGSAAASLTPEIILAEPGERKIPKYKKGNWKPPITTVNKTATQESAAAQPVQTATAANCVQSTPSLAIEAEGVSPGVSVATNSGTANLFENYTQSISTADSISTTFVPHAHQQDVPIHVDSMAETKISENDPESIVTEIDALLHSIDQTQAELDPVESTALESPAVLDGILRPTIMPLRPNATTDVLSGEPSAMRMETTTSDPVSSNTESQASRSDDFVADEPSYKKSTEDPPSQIIEIINGLEGTSFEALTQQDTVPQQDWVEYKSGSNLTPAFSEAAVPVAEPNSQPVPDEIPNHGKDSESGAVDNGPLVTFPTDNRGQRFHYLHTKKQKLVNSISDQIIERFPNDAHSTIMLVAANRDIDVDGAASKIATCLATRDIGEILLVDGNLASRQLTTVLGLVSRAGIADAFAVNGDATDAISPTDNARLNVLGAGNTDAAALDGNCPIPTATHQSIRQAFDYSIISGGVAGDHLTDAWAGVVDGVYLLVDMDGSDRNETVAAVDYLRQLGARLVGCIAIR